MSKIQFEIDKNKLEVKMIEQWWGPRKYITKVEILEPKVGGKWFLGAWKKVLVRPGIALKNF